MHHIISLKSYINRHKFILLISFCILAIKLNIINWGAPFSYHQDEQWFLMRSLHFLKGNIHPGAFHQPSLYHYINAVVLGIFALFLKVINNITNWELYITQNIFSFIIMGRLFNILLSTFNILVFYKTLMLISNKKAAIIGATCFGLNYLMFRESLYMTNETLLLLFNSLFLYSLVSKQKLLSVIFIGLSLATKYTGVLLIPVYLLYYRESFDMKTIFKEGLLLSGSFLIFFLLNPFILLDFKNFYLDYSYLSGLKITTWFNYLSNLKKLIFVYLLEIFHFALIPILLKLTFKYKKIDGIELAILLYIFITIFFLSRYSYFSPRYYIPLIPFIYFFCFKNLSLILNKKILLILILTILSFSITKIYLITKIIKNDDTRNIAKTFIETNIPENSLIGIEGNFYSPKLDQTIEQLNQKILYGKNPRFSDYSTKRLIYEKSILNKKRYNLFYFNKNSTLSASYYGSPTVKYETYKDSNAYKYLILNDTDNKFDFDFKKENLIFTIASFNKHRLSDITGLPFFLSELISGKHIGPSIEIYRTTS